MQLNASGAIGLAIGIFFLLFYVPRLWAMDREEAEHHVEGIAKIAPFPVSWTRAVYRCVPLIMSAIVLGTLAFVAIDWLANRQIISMQISLALGRANSVLLLSALVLSGSIALANRPRFLVPRGLRDQRGIFDFRS